MARRKKKDPTPESIARTEKRKATQAEVARRVNHIYKMLIQGATRADILQDAAEKWGIEERQTDDYLARARAELKKKLDADKDELLKMAYERLTIIFAKTMRVMDYQRAIAAQREINLLFGLYAPAKQEHRLDDKQLDKLLAKELTDDELAEAFLNSKE